MALNIDRSLLCTNPANMGHNPDGTLSRRSASDIKYIVVHYTGTVDASAYNFAEYTCHGTPGASTHYVVGFDGEIFQSVDDLNIAWHVGIGTNPKPGIYYRKPDGVNESNNWTCIGIEMCCHKVNHATLSAYDKDWYFTPATIDATVELVQMLMAKYNVDLDHVIRHYDTSSWDKLCPRPFTGSDINTYYQKTAEQLYAEFKARVAGGTPDKVTQPWIVYPKLYVGRIVSKGPADVPVRVSASGTAKTILGHPRLGDTNLVEVLGQTSSSNWSFVRIAGMYEGWIKTANVVDAGSGKQSKNVQRVDVYTKNCKDYVARIIKDGPASVPVKASYNDAAKNIVWHPTLGKDNLVDVLGSADSGKWLCVNICGAKGWIRAEYAKKV